MKNEAICQVESFFEEINSLLELSVKHQIGVADKGKYPICMKDKELVVCPDFFKHPELRDNVRKVLMAELYSCIYLDQKLHGQLDVNPGFMAKGICSLMAIDFVSDEEIEQNLRSIRRKLFDEVEYSCYFSVGHKLRESAFVSYEVTNIVRKDKDNMLVTVKPIGCNLGKPERTMTEEELYQRCCNFRDLKNEKVDMRRNLIVISGPSGVGKDTVVKTLLKTHPAINKTVSVTTRSKRSNETEGVDYYYITKDQFYQHQIDGSLVEYELYDGAYYGTLFTEVERHPENTPLILVIDVRGRRNVSMRYPMAKSIFIAPPSFDVLKERIIARNENTPDEIEHRLTVAKEELEQASKYDYSVVNDELTSCVKQIAEIINGNI